MLVRRFIVALTRGGPNGIPRPIELHAHDPVRYCGDMLAWVHQAIATESEFFRVLFDGDGDFVPEATPVPEVPSEGGDTSAPAPAPVSMVGKAFEGVARPLQVRIEQTLSAPHSIVVAYKLVLLVAFYDHTVAPLVTNSALALALAHCRATAHRVFHQQLALLVETLATSAQDYSTNLSATHATMDASQRLVALLEVFQTSLLPMDALESDLAPLFDAVLPALAHMCDRSIHGLDATDALVFRVNNFSCLHVPLVRFPEATAWLARMASAIASWLEAISALESTSVLDRCGVSALLEQIQRYEVHLCSGFV